MKKKKSIKSTVNLKSLKRLLKASSKEKMETKDLTTKINSTTLVALSLLLIISLFNYKSISNYFSNTSQAAIINISTHVSLLPDNAREDMLSDASEMGVVFLSLNSNNFNDAQIRYHYFEPTGDVDTPMLTIGNEGDFDLNFIKTHGRYVIYTSAENIPRRIFWHDLLGAPFNRSSIPHKDNQFDVEGDISNGKIVLIRSTNGKTNIWQYDIGNTESEQITFIDSNKNHIRYNEDNIVWTDDRNGNLDIYMYDFSNPNPEGVQITNNTSDQSQPSIHNNKIVWTDDRNGNLDIYMYDLNNPVENGIQITTNDANQQKSDIYNDQIVWEDSRNEEIHGFTHNIDVYMYDLNQGIEHAVPGDIANKSDQQAPNIVQNKIIWTYVYGQASTFGPNRDLFVNRFDELNLLTPENNLLFTFEDILLQWDYFTANHDPVVFKVRVLLDGTPFTPPNGLPIGSDTKFPLASDKVESYPDGEFEWSILPLNQNNWDEAESRLIIKKVAADLITPDNGIQVEINELFDWEDIPGAINYVAKIEGYLPSNLPYYFPFNNPESQFILIEPVYNLLKPGVEYKWSIAGTALDENLPTNPNHPDYAQMASLHFGESRTFTK